MTFTDKKPTVPGDYRINIKPEAEDVFGNLPGEYLVSVYDLAGELAFRGSNVSGYVCGSGILWSSRLVPSDESEAYQEGYQHAFDEIVHSRARRVPVEEVVLAWNEAVVGDTPWLNSRAHRVVEGKETP